MWWTSRPARRHRRTVVLDVARPPAADGHASGPRRRCRRDGRRSRGRASRPRGPGLPSPRRHRGRRASGEPVAAAMRRRGAVGGQRLGRRPEVEAAPGGEAQQPRAARRAPRCASPRAGTPRTSSAASASHRREVAVIAQGDERRGDGGVDGALGLLRGAQRDAHGLREQPARSASGGRPRRWRASARSRGGSGCTRGRWRRARPPSRRSASRTRGLVDHDDRGGADRLQGRRGVGGAHEPPEVTGGGGGACWMRGRLLRGRGRRLRRRGRGRGLLLRRRRRRGRVVGLPVPALVVAGRVARRRAPRRLRVGAVARPGPSPSRCPAWWPPRARSRSPRRAPPPPRRWPSCGAVAVGRGRAGRRRRGRANASVEPEGP